MEYHPSNHDVAQKCRLLDYIDIGEEPLISFHGNVAIIHHWSLNPNKKFYNWGQDYCSLTSWNFLLYP